MEPVGGVDSAGGGGASTGVSVELLGDALASGGAGVSEGGISVQAAVASNEAAPTMISLVLMMTMLSCYPATIDQALTMIAFSSHAATSLRRGEQTTRQSTDEATHAESFIRDVADRKLAKPEPR